LSNPWIPNNPISGVIVSDTGLNIKLYKMCLKVPINGQFKVGMPPVSMWMWHADATHSITI